MLERLMSLIGRESRTGGGREGGVRLGAGRDGGGMRCAFSLLLSSLCIVLYKSSIVEYRIFAALRYSGRESVEKLFVLKAVLVAHMRE